jgi:formiminotetrahydrofolate cyclodeaminase
MSLTNQTVRDLLAAFRSSDPTPGGGSASALAGAIGSALLTMVAGLERPRAATAKELERLAAAGQRAAALSEELTALVDRDSAAYASVMAAYKLPKTSEAEIRTRTGSIQTALLEATRTPLDVMRTCAAAMTAATDVAALGNPNASSDVQVAIELLRAGLRGARLNVEINLASLKDHQRAEEIRAEMARLATTDD